MQRNVDLMCLQTTDISMYRPLTATPSLCQVNRCIIMSQIEVGRRNYCRSLLMIMLGLTLTPV